MNGKPDLVRNNLREALTLLRDAGYEVRNTKLVNTKTGEPYAVEFLIGESAFQRVILFYKPALERLGIAVAVRLVDSAQYENRLRQWDFDIVVASWGKSLSPGNEQRGFWGSQAADEPGSRNLVGIKDQGDRCPHRSRDLCQKPRRAGRRHARARSRPAVAPLRRAAMDFGHAAHRPLGPLLASGKHAEIRRGRVPHGLVVRRAEGGQAAAAVVMRGVSRRRVLLLSAAAAASAATPTLPVRAAGVADEQHGMSAFGDLAYPSDFKNFGYVNPAAPKGGRYSEAVSSRGYNGSFLTFNSLNGFILKGDGAVGLELNFASLMVRSATSPTPCTGWRRVACASPMMA